jgi:hypothetical protein
MAEDETLNKAIDDQRVWDRLTASQQADNDQIKETNPVEEWEEAEGNVPPEEDEVIE